MLGMLWGTGNIPALMVGVQAGTLSQDERRKSAGCRGALYSLLTYTHVCTENTFTLTHTYTKTCKETQPPM